MTEHSLDHRADRPLAAFPHGPDRAALVSGPESRSFNPESSLLKSLRRHFQPTIGVASIETNEQAWSGMISGHSNPGSDFVGKDGGSNRRAGENPPFIQSVNIQA